MLRAPFVSFWQRQKGLRQVVYFGPSPHCAQWGWLLLILRIREKLYGLWALFQRFSSTLVPSLEIFSETITTCGGFAETCLTTEAYDFLGISDIFLAEIASGKLAEFAL